MVIDGEWREPTDDESELMTFVTWRCIVHSMSRGCECRLPDCVKEMIPLAKPIWRQKDDH